MSFKTTNSSPMNSHLTSEQMDGLLSARPSEDVVRHVAGCVRCTAEIGSLRGVLTGLREGATAAAEHHRGLAGPRNHTRRAPQVAWSLAAIALFVSVGAPLAVHRFHGFDRPAVAAQPATAISDEALLSSVQDDLSYSVPGPLLPLTGASPSDSATSTQRTN